MLPSAFSLSPEQPHFTWSPAWPSQIVELFIILTDEPILPQEPEVEIPPPHPCSLFSRGKFPVGLHNMSSKYNEKLPSDSSHPCWKPCIRGLLLFSREHACLNSGLSMSWTESMYVIKRISNSLNCIKLICGMCMFMLVYGGQRSTLVVFLSLSLPSVLRHGLLMNLELQLYLLASTP